MPKQATREPALRPDARPRRNAVASRVVTANAAPVNALVDWDDFDSGWYLDHNYKKLREDDQEIVRLVRDFFASVTREAPGPIRRGIDVGAGANLYPALCMLPFCARIDLFERASSNVKWLVNEVENGYSESWNLFWDELAESPPYAALPAPRATLTDRATVIQGDLFALEESRWDMGTMFFVAESLTTELSEFELALGSFLDALRPGAPFAAAFMENSKGYNVAGRDYPAVKIEQGHVRAGLAGVADDVRIHRIDSAGLRDGYTGMLIALGRKNPEPQRPGRKNTD